METEILKSDKIENIFKVVSELKSGGLVGLPTETVYGLGADVFNLDAVERIFSVKKRPFSDPLIVHIADKSDLERVVNFDMVSDKKLLWRLVDDFFPGPLTLILPKSDLVSDKITAGSEFVAVRMSSNKIFSEVVRGLGNPIAAPSANKFMSISPTNAIAVKEELGDELRYILDGGSCEHGLESTILKLEGSDLVIYREGLVGLGELSSYGNVYFKKDMVVDFPGSFRRHYSPKTRAFFLSYEEALAFDFKKGIRYGLLFCNLDKHKVVDWLDLALFMRVENLSVFGDEKEVARRVYSGLRMLDCEDIDEIIVEKFDLEKKGTLRSAIYDRLSKACSS